MGKKQHSWTRAEVVTIVESIEHAGATVILERIYNQLQEWLTTDEEVCCFNVLDMDDEKAEKHVTGLSWALKARNGPIQDM